MAIFTWKNKSDDAIIKLINGQLERAKQARRIYEPLWEIIIKVFRPRRYDILGGDEEGRQYGSTVYDQHPANALNKFVSGLVGYMVSRSTPWLQFISPDARLMQYDHIKQYCQEATEQILYAAGRSNLYSAVVPHALDGHSVGTTVMIPNDDELKDRVVFDTVHPRDSYVICNRFGDPQIYFRELKLTRLSALDYFGKDKLPVTWFDKDSNLKDALNEHEFVWSVYPNEDRDPESLLPVDREFAVFCVMRTTSTKSQLVLKSGRRLFPITWRTMAESGAAYGTSICADCLTGGLVANKLGEKLIAAAHQTVEPTVLISSTLRSAIMRAGGLNPGGRIYADDANRENVRPILERLNWPVSDAQLERLHNQIDDRFFIRFFEMLSAGDLKARTAYEVSQMMAEKAALMTCIVDTFEQESLEPAVEALIFYETEQGRMPEPPPELLTSGSRLSIRYLGPLAQLQRTLLTSKGTIDAINLIAQIATISQDVLWKFNWLEIAEDVAISQGMSQKRIRSDEEVAAIQEQVNQQQMAMAQAEMGEKMAKGTEALGKRVEPNSPLEKLFTAGGIK